MDPRLTLVAGAAAAVGSERVRKVVGRGLGYATAGAMKVGNPVVQAGRDIVDEARGVATSNGTAKRSSSRRTT